MGLGWLIGGYGFGGSAPIWEKVDVNTIALIGSGEEASEELWEKVGKYVAQTFVRYGWHLVFCGTSQGIEGKIAEFVSQKGGTVTAVIIKGKQPPEMVENVKKVQVNSYRNRKKKMYDLADAFLILPGGLGTLDDLTDIVANQRIDKERKPVVVLDPDHWFDSISDFYQKGIDEEFIDVYDIRKLFVAVHECKRLKHHITRYWI